MNIPEQFVVHSFTFCLDDLLEIQFRSAAGLVGKLIVIHVV